MPKDLAPYIAPLIVLLIVIRRAGRARRVRTGNIWVIPGLALLATAVTLAREPFPSVVATGLFVLAAIAGVGVGYFRALHLNLSVDQNTGEVSTQPTQLGTILMVAFVLLRMVLDFAFKGHVNVGDYVGPQIPHVAVPAHGVDLFRLTDAALIFSAAMVIAQRLETWRRAHSMLEEYRANKASAPPVEPAQPPS